MTKKFRVWTSNNSYQDLTKEEYSEFDNTQLHRTDGPAVIDDYGEAWYQNGQQHRVDGPAAIHRKLKMWYQNGELHRLCGPAVEWSDNDDNIVRWWIHGKSLDTQEVQSWLEQNNIDLSTTQGQMAFLLRFSG